VAFKPQLHQHSYEYIPDGLDTCKSAKYSDKCAQSESLYLRYLLSRGESGFASDCSLSGVEESSPGVEASESNFVDLLSSTPTSFLLPPASYMP
jgi:hypothetical protein